MEYCEGVGASSIVPGSTGAFQQSFLRKKQLLLFGGITIPLNKLWHLPACICCCSSSIYSACNLISVQWLGIVDIQQDLIKSGCGLVREGILTCRKLKSFPISTSYVTVWTLFVPPTKNISRLVSLAACEQQNEVAVSKIKL